MKKRAIAALLVLFATAPSGAINVVIDYSLDTGEFFGDGNPDGPAAGAAARAAMDEAARFFSVTLSDTFDAIETPPAYTSSVFDGEFVWQWSANFTHPSTGSAVTLVNETIAADEYRVYAGARSLSGNTLGLGGAGGYSCCAISSEGSFTTAEIDELNAIDSAFTAAVTNRGEPDGQFSFANWGGAVTFDSDGSINWHYDHTKPTPAGASDFFSVAVHELGHAVGISSNEWDNRISGTQFLGPASFAANGNSNPSIDFVVSNPGAHWAEGTMSTIAGTSTAQEASMDPTLTVGTRKRWTDLDGAALTDIGWEYTAPPLGDYNADFVVDASDYTLWRDNFQTRTPFGKYSDWAANFGVGAGSAATVPAPNAVSLSLLAVLAAAAGRRS